MGNTLYLAGQVGRDIEGRLAKGDAKAQTIQALKNIKAILEEANTSMENVVKTTVYFKRRADIVPIREGRQLYFKNKPPASTLIQIAGFSEEDILVEIDATAFVP